MLQRAASNAYSWWWASHIRTKQSKWLEHNLQDMEEKVQCMLKLIDDDGDSFAKRAEMYYRKKPELINFVEEYHRAYKALAERYDRISGDLQNANHTIATVFPEQVQYAMDEEEDDDGFTRESSRSVDPSKVPKEVPQIPTTNIPKFLKNPKKEIEGSFRRPSKKMPPKRTTSSVTSTISQISKREALKAIDKLQKGILALQTEKEFIKSSYENRIAKYREIDEEISEMQEKVSSLQDEFSVGTVIEDDEARTLMGSTALRSCQETLIQLQEKQDRSIEEAKVEYRRIKDTHKKLEAFKNEFLQNQTDKNPQEKDAMNAAVGHLQPAEMPEAESIHAKIREHFEVNSDTSLTVTELAEKIDELVTKVIRLETAVSSQTALIKRLRLETDELQEQLGTLEADKAALLKDSNKLTEKIKELEEKLCTVEDLNRNVENQNNNLAIHFTEAHCNLDHLSKKLKSAKEPDKEIETTCPSQQEEASLVVHAKPHKEKEEVEDEDLTTASEESKTKKAWKTEAEEEKDKESSNRPPSLYVRDQEDFVVQQPMNSDNIDDSLSTKDSSSKQQQEGVEHEQVKDTSSKQLLDGVKNEYEKDNLLSHELDQEDLLNWQELFLNGLDGREKILLAEYTSVLRKYKETKKKLSDVEKKNRDSLFETLFQLRELKSSNVVKDEEIRSLRKKISFLQTSGTWPESEDPTSHAEDTIRADESNANKEADGDGLSKTKEEGIVIDEARTLSPIEEKFRTDIDDLLEENLEFWLRFSTSFHQIQKYQTAVHDLQAEYLKLKQNKKQDGTSCTSTNSSLHQSLKSDARPIYKHLREIETELTVCLEHTMLLKDEVKHRLSSLSKIQEEISGVLKASSGADEAEFTSYQAAKFQGEILNMQQENNKVAQELKASVDHVKALQFEIQKTLSNMDEDFKLSGSKNHQNMIHSLSRTRIPLRSFLFGVKLKKRKESSIFSCMSPALQKQYSDLQSNMPI